MLFKFIISFIAGIGTGFTVLTSAVLTVEQIRTFN